MARLGLPQVFASTVIDAAHGAYRRKKTKNEKADRGVNICSSISGRLVLMAVLVGRAAWLNREKAAKLPPLPPSARTTNVLTTASFADNPVISAAAARQSPKPKGAKTGAMNLPAAASRLFSGLSAGANPAPQF